MWGAQGLRSAMRLSLGSQIWVARWAVLAWVDGVWANTAPGAGLAPALRALWEEELAGMRQRIKAMRVALVLRLQAAGVPGDLGYITTQQGMFSYSGLNAAQMQRLRSEFGVYGVDSGRICVAALNEKNLDAVASAIAAVV